MKEIFYQLIVQYYTYFYRRDSSKFNYNLSIDNKKHKLINNFIDLLDQEWGLESLGESFLWSYFLYSFFYWKDKKTLLGKNNTQLNWICGVEGIQKFKNKDENWQFFAQNYIISNGLSFDELRKKKKLNRESFFLLQKKERLRFYNTTKGLANCIEFTSGFNWGLVECLKCKNKKECKAIVRDDKRDL